MSRTSDVIFHFSKFSFLYFCALYPPNLTRESPCFNVFFCFCSVVVVVVVACSYPRHFFIYLYFTLKSCTSSCGICVAPFLGHTNKHLSNSKVVTSFCTTLQHTAPHRSAASQPAASHTYVHSFNHLSVRPIFQHQQPILNVFNIVCRLYHTLRPTHMLPPRQVGDLHDTFDIIVIDWTI